MKSRFRCKLYISIMFSLDYLELVIWKIIVYFFVALQSYFEIVVIYIKDPNKLTFIFKYLI